MSATYIITFIFVILYIQYLIDYDAWNDGVCIKTNNLWIMTHMDMWGRRHYISFNNGTNEVANFIFPVDKDYYSK